MASTGVEFFSKQSYQAHWHTDSPSGEKVLDSEEDTKAKVARDLEATAMVAKVAEEKACPALGLWQPSLPLPHRLMSRMSWWAKVAPPPVLHLLQHGVCPDWPEPDLEVLPCHRPQQEVAEAKKLMVEYTGLGACRPVSNQDAPTRYLIPWFLLKKPEGGGRK